MRPVLRGKVPHAERIARKGERGGKKVRRRTYPAGVFGATLRNAGGSAQKARLVADLIRPRRQGNKKKFLTVDQAEQVVRNSKKRAAYYFSRSLRAAWHNAEARTEGAVSMDQLYVIDAYADQAPMNHRYKIGPRGRTRPIQRHRCHITVVLGTEEVVAEREGET